MVDSITSVQANKAAFTAAVQLAETAELNNAISAADTQSFSFPPEVTPAQIDQALLNNTDIPPDGLVNLDNSTLELLSEIGSDPASANITGNLTAQQIQEIGVLQQDALMLDEVSVANDLVPLTAGATTVDLSLAAQGLAAANIVSIAATTPPPVTFTPQQLAQIAQIIAPYINQPLTPSLVVQIQAQLVANQINPLQFNLGVYFLVQNYMASQVAHENAPETDRPVLRENDETTVGPVGTTDKVAVEDMAIRT